MQLFIIAVGNKMPDWVESGYKEYEKRMPSECKLNLKEIRPVDRSSNRSAESVMAAECTRIKSALPKNARVIALDEHGKNVTTMQLAQELEKWQQEGRDVVFVIGGADGLDSEFKKEADDLFRLSNMTLPHGMVRVLLAEQLYRAWSITKNHPYHRS
ncbi:23S rRNA (pseudouridine(1915)-N(3))-methyltransferase RlmH [Oxalobacter vibrioformis]|uniref:Ribosomal RNA large subunit methyltransferase H n=1 Tax=Oxalobacter vibrioformis TaxID=933080 RepID=A0A9E9LWK8_9BURK|nr:23S rRNA (pseudouridine(1915)-N(3))-methyltransferase RlmH [Oxalobacter vibrioformis]WAW10581.1 23S rRNA (pseudouridine(1915)-N(3))-methyltransferase RlmH [Oxalobacter vibrioformis]